MMIIIVVIIITIIMMIIIIIIMMIMIIVNNNTNNKDNNVYYTICISYHNINRKTYDSIRAAPLDLSSIRDYHTSSQTTDSSKSYL